MAIIDRDGIPGKVCSKCKSWQPLTEFSPKVVRGVPHGDGHQPWCKSCHRKRARSKYKENPEKFRARSLDYVRRNSEKVRVRERERYYADLERQRERKRLYERARAQADPEGRRLRGRVWYYKNRERRRAKNRASRQNHIEAARERLRRWMKAHPGKSAAYQRARRVRLAGGGRFAHRCRAGGAQGSLWACLSSLWETRARDRNHPRSYCASSQKRQRRHRKHSAPVPLLQRHEGGADHRLPATTRQRTA